MLILIMDSTKPSSAVRPTPSQIPTKSPPTANANISSYWPKLVQNLDKEFCKEIDNFEDIPPTFQHTLDLIIKENLISL